MRNLWAATRPYLYEVLILALGIMSTLGIQAVLPGPSPQLDVPGEVRLKRGKLAVLDIRGSVKPRLLVGEDVSANVDVVQVGDLSWHVVPHVDAKSGNYQIPVVAAVAKDILSRVYFLKLVVE